MWSVLVLRLFRPDRVARAEPVALNATVPLMQTQQCPIDLPAFAEAGEIVARVEGLRRK